MIKMAISKGMFRGIELDGECDQLTHLQFVDDTLIFIEGSLESVKVVKRILQCFQLLTGLKINFNKSSLFSCDKNCSLVSEGAKLLRCMVGSWSLNFLGAPLGLSARRKRFWNPLIKKFENKLANWRSSSLNKAGRLVLSKSTLDSLPVYWFNIYKVPKGVCSEIEKIRRNFSGDIMVVKGKCIISYGV